MRQHNFHAQVTVFSHWYFVIILQISFFVRKTVFIHRESLAIRWGSLPGKIGMTKAQLFAKLSSHKYLCSISSTREMLQTDGSMKAVPCILVQTTAFSQIMRGSLRAGKKIQFRI